jgi:hypothetical protein
MQEIRDRLFLNKFLWLNEIECGGRGRFSISAAEFGSISE